MSTNISNLPQDKTPAQRARIKLYEQFGVVFLLNAILAGHVLFSSQSSGSKPNWSVVIIAAIAQGLIALFNVVEKYFSANSQPLYSALFDAARQEVASKAPPVQYSATDQALQQSVNAAFQPTYTTLPQSATYTVYTPAQSAVVPSSLKPTVLQPLPADSTPVVPVSVPNTPPVGATLLNTIPQIAAVQTQQ